MMYICFMQYPNIEQLDPRQCVNGQVNRLKRFTGNVFRKHIEPFGVTSSQLSLLFILSKRRSHTQVELTKITILEKSSLNRNLKRLLEMDLLAKGNNRQILITEKGLDLVEKIIPEWEKAMREIEEILGKVGVLGLQQIDTHIKNYPL